MKEREREGARQKEDKLNFYKERESERKRQKERKSEKEKRER